MTLSVIAFAVMSFVAVLFSGATLVAEMNLKHQAATRLGDTSLKPGSVVWLGTLAFAGSVLICYFAN